MPTVHRCAWSDTNSLMAAYHDEEWGVPEFDSRALWEKLMLDGFQAGLSWLTILKRRGGFRAAFEGFEPERVAALTDLDVDRLMLDPEIIRARAKIVATIGNARAYLKMKEAGIDFSAHVWQLAGSRQIQNPGPERVITSPASEAISKDLKRRGFKFVGPVIVYAWMQATGLVNDHDQRCFRRKACKHSF